MNSSELKPPDKHLHKKEYKAIGHDGLYYQAKNLTLVKGEKTVKLDATTARLLQYFLDNPGKVIARAELIEQVWQTNFVSDNAINRTISVLRKELGGDTNYYITTIPKKGYCFVHPEPPDETPLTQANETISEKPITKTAKPSAIKPTKIHWLAGGFLATLVLLLLWRMDGAFISNETQTPAIRTGLEVINIAVVPFASSSNEPNQQLLADGLTEEVINLLTRIPGLVVFDVKPEKTAVNSKNNAQYLLQGTVRKRGRQIRVSVKLVNTSSGAYLFSTVFDRPLEDIFVVQQNIAAQVGAALKLSLLHKVRYMDYHSSALQKIDYLGVEQLVIAHARLNTNNDSSIGQGTDLLFSLNQRYPQTPEIMGLLAWAYYISGNTAQQSEFNPRHHSTKMAKAALQLDPTNLNALKVLYYYYSNQAEFREQAYAISERIVTLHPGRQSAWRTRLHLMINTMRPCQEILTFVKSIPQGVFTDHRLKIINHILAVCLQEKPLEALADLKTNTDQKTINKAINNNLYLFNIRHDMAYSSLRARIRRKPTQASLTDYYLLQLAAGAQIDAADTKKWIENKGAWGNLISIYNTLYGLPVTHNISDDPLSYSKLAPFHIVHQVAAALITQAKQTGDNSTITRYQSQAAPFAINLFNRLETIALMMLQHHQGLYSQSQLTAKKLFDKLAVYHQNHPQSFTFWSLGSDFIIAKFYCGAQCKFPINKAATGSSGDVLRQLFKPNHPWWMDDIGFMKVALSPWLNEPIVAQYLNLIEQDRLRFRAQNAL